MKNILSIACLFLGLPGLADQRPRAEVTALEVNELGHPIVRVRLSTLKPGVPDRTFRFLFDTGAGQSVLDTSVPADFFWEDGGGDLSMVDGTRQKVANQTVHLKRLTLAGRTQDDLTALRLDLKGSFIGRLQDEPVDGILGMSALRDTRFVLDMERKEIRWWQGIQGHSLPLGFNPGGNPTFDVELGGTVVPCMVDTGAVGGFQAPGEAGGKPTPEELYYYASVTGAVMEGRSVRMPKIPAGERSWKNVDLELVKPGEGNPQVGLDVLGAAPVALDFLRQRITFAINPDGSLPYRKDPCRVLLGWEPRSGGRVLVVHPLRPVSAYYKAGLRTGDEVLRVGSLEGEALTLWSVRDFLQKGVAHGWRVRRGGQTLDLQVPSLR